ncbi:MAG: class I SAM-dependent methyltransferase [Chloroflexi bacterium]|nr:class I SAM-dependent methyltransferase [Chloroflexota bacterium]
MRELDLAGYAQAFGRIHGAFTMDAALLFFAYASLAGERGHVMEIGVHHGLSAIAVAALRGEGARMVALDTFGASGSATASGGMSADERTFRASMERFHGDTSFVRVIAADSRAVAPGDLGAGFSFCHIDGGHSAEETRSDLALASAVCRGGGLVALDDYFNPSFPGVSEGTVRHLIERPGDLAPLAIGANKVLFRRGAAGDLNARLGERYPFIPRTRAVFAGSEVLVFGSGLAHYVDIGASSVGELRPRELRLRVDLEPHVDRLIASPGTTVPLRVRVRNRSNVPLEWSDSPFGLSYHVTGPIERYENARVWFEPALAEGQERLMDVQVQVPERPGEYTIEIDVVWEGICWLRDRGNRPATARLTVR